MLFKWVIFFRIFLPGQCRRVVSIAMKAGSVINVCDTVNLVNPLPQRPQLLSRWPVPDFFLVLRPDGSGQRGVLTKQLVYVRYFDEMKSLIHCPDN